MSKQPNITYKEFIDYFYKRVYPHKGKYIRTGQALMNWLAKVWFEKYRYITGTSVDCFYKDSVIPHTLKYLDSEWPTSKTVENETIESETWLGVFTKWQKSQIYSKTIDGLQHFLDVNYQPPINK